MHAFCLCGIPVHCHQCAACPCSHAKQQAISHHQLFTTRLHNPPCRWTIQTLGGVFCLLMGLTSKSLGATMAILVIFSVFCQQSCGLSFGVVPFVSKRSTGLVSGFVGSGGNVGGAVTQVRRQETCAACCRGPFERARTAC